MIAIIVLAAGAAGSLHADGVRTFTYAFEETHPAGSAKILSISNTRGDIDITGVSGDSVRIRAQKIVRTKDSDRADEIARDTEIRIRQDGEKLIIHAEIPSFDSKHSDFFGAFTDRPDVRVNYRISVPEHFGILSKSTSGDFTLNSTGNGVTCQSTSGDISITDVNGTVTSQSSSGDTEMKNIEGSVNVQCTSGDISLQNARGDIDCSLTSGDVVLTMIQGDIAVKATSGDVNIRQARGNVSTSSSSGDISVRELEGSFRGETTSGDCSVRGAFDRTPGCVVASISGSIEIGAASGGNYDITCETISGSIRSTLPMDVRKSTRRLLQGKTGRGNIPLTAETTSGSISIRSIGEM
jgi:DUF4097 and DUF4098 domain-containing protein YvlB